MLSLAFWTSTRAWNPTSPGRRWQTKKRSTAWPKWPITQLNRCHREWQLTKNLTSTPMTILRLTLCLGQPLGIGGRFYLSRQSIVLFLQSGLANHKSWGSPGALILISLWTWESFWCLVEKKIGVFERCFLLNFPLSFFSSLSLLLFYGGHFCMNNFFTWCFLCFFYSCATLLGYPQIFEMDLLSGMQRAFGRARGVMRRAHITGGETKGRGQHACRQLVWSGLGKKSPKFRWGLV